MDIFFTDIGAIHNDPTADSRLKRSLGLNNQGTLKATYKLLGSEQVGDKIRIHKLFKDDIVDISLSSLFAQDPGTQLVGDIGDNDSADGVGDLDRYVDSLDISGGGFFSYQLLPSIGVVANAPYEVREFLGDGTWLEFTITAENTLTADQLITFSSMISRPNG